MNYNITIGITCGDINGIGLEIILKALLLKKAGQQLRLAIYGSTKVVAYHKNIITPENIQFHSINAPEEAQPGRINIINCWTENVNITLGKPTEISGKCAYLALERAVNDLKTGNIDALVTAPIHKKAMQLAGFPFVGHTEYITQALGAKDSLMLLISDDLRVGLVTNHLPLREVAGAITKEKILDKIFILSETLKVDFGINKPTIAVLGLNPHAGDEGTIGDEEVSIIRPAIEQAKESGILAYGPFPADGFFGSGMFRKFDAILAMYHDQGLAPFKTLSFGDGVNYSAGLPAVRTSPDHGTAYDIAGKGEADETSFIRALYLAADIVHNRNEYLEMRANALEVAKRKTLVSETGEDEEIVEVPEE
ncbi:MAG: 4-hydroxythreonine-4-phosphate dehydrogenase PdxA [Saprospiraceae bacterium]|nr:4-hydroxythreonine-4-phosphate dehydrogenase PdxA [Saprospiraceae bacterium]MDW8483621.1 4-hydroxythreonine-4-phosphate dehydrogenase PdxA [Saprospiraceae bacterium]